MNSEQLCTLVVDALDDIKAKDVKTSPATLYGVMWFMLEKAADYK